MGNSNFERGYKKIKVLGEDAMGIVHLCEQKSLSRRVTVRLLKDRLHDKELKFRFKREAKILANIRHENLARVYDFDANEEPPYIVQEYLSGRTLQGLICEKGKLPAQQCIDIAKQITAGLIQVHALNVVHRDLKPTNIFIEDSETVKILDFGLTLGNLSMARLTKTVPGLGPLQYMAPEQLSASVATERTDLYALGAIMYEMLTGHAPIEAATLEQLREKKQENDIRPLQDECAQSLPAPLVELVAELLKKEASERPRDAVTVMSRLHELSFLGGIPEAYEKELVPIKKPEEESSDKKSSTPPSSNEKPKISKLAILSLVALFIVLIALLYSTF